MALKLPVDPSPVLSRTQVKYQRQPTKRDCCHAWIKLSLFQEGAGDSHGNSMGSSNSENGYNWCWMPQLLAITGYQRSCHHLNIHGCAGRSFTGSSPYNVWMKLTYSFKRVSAKSDSTGDRSHLEQLGGNLLARSRRPQTREWLMASRKHRTRSGRPSSFQPLPQFSAVAQSSGSQACRCTALEYLATTGAAPGHPVHQRSDR